VLTLVAGLIGLALLPRGICFGWLMMTGRLVSTNYPGAVLAIPAELLILPVAILSIWKQEFGGKLAVIVGIAGCAGAPHDVPGKRRIEETWRNGSYSF